MKRFRVAGTARTGSGVSALSMREMPVLRIADDPRLISRVLVN
jgi:hypothetical protein